MKSSKFTSTPLFPRQALVALLLPLIAEQALSVTIGLADTLMVSSVGEAAVSGVSLVDSFNTLMIQIMSALATGGAVVTSQYIGHQEPKNDPWQALWFIVLFLVLQQIEGNLIYPHVVGSSVGLPSIWVLAAVTVGGSLMGIVGMLLFIPLCSVLYALLRRLVYTRLRAKNIPSRKWRQPPQT